VNLVGHVAVAVSDDDAPAPDAEFLVGCMLPDLAAIARVRMTSKPGGELGHGVEFHHACDVVFHESVWFRARTVEVRDALLAAGVDRGAARACAHAGVEMVLDGALVADTRLREHVRTTLVAVDAAAGTALAGLVAGTDRAEWAQRLRMIARSLDPQRYAHPRFVAERLHRMTSGRPRIALRAEHVDVVADTLAGVRVPIGEDAAGVVGHVRAAVGRPGGRQLSRAWSR